jgi:hypothetical protein
MRPKALPWFVALGGSAALGVAALSGVAVGAVTPGEPFSVSPSQGAPFTVVAVSGANCTGPSPSVIAELVSATGPIPGADVVVFATPDVNGDWSDSFTIPPVVAPGQYQVVARCLPDQFDPQPVEYGPQPFEVLPDGLASMSASPTRAVAGTDVVLAVSGTLCRGADAIVDLRVELASAQVADEPVARGMFTPDAEGSWSGQVTVPATATAGTYIVGTQCRVSGQPFFLYVPPPELELVQPAVPVPARPTFTG